MKKQELIHLHALFVEVAEYCTEEGERLDLAEYHERDTGPMAIRASKADHEAAVLGLARGVAGSVRSGTDELEVSTD